MSFRSLLPLFLVVLIFVIAVVDAMALRYHLFYTLPWFDIPLHLLGGLWVSLFILWYYSIFRNNNARIEERGGMFIFALSGTFAVALAWELFEYTINAYIVLDKYDMIDTFKDLLMGMIGATVGTWIFIHKIHKKHTS